MTDWPSATNKPRVPITARQRIEWIRTNVQLLRYLTTICPSDDATTEETELFGRLASHAIGMEGILLEHDRPRLVEEQAADGSG